MLKPPKGWIFSESDTEIVLSNKDGNTELSACKSLGSPDQMAIYQALHSEAVRRNRIDALSNQENMRSKTSPI